MSEYEKTAPLKIYGYFQVFIYHLSSVVHSATLNKYKIKNRHGHIILLLFEGDVIWMNNKGINIVYSGNIFS